VCAREGGSGVAYRVDEEIAVAACRPNQPHLGRRRIYLPLGARARSPVQADSFSQTPALVSRVQPRARVVAACPAV